MAEAVACEVFENYPELANRLKAILSHIQVCGVAISSRIFVKAGSAAHSEYMEEIWGKLTHMKWLLNDYFSFYAAADDVDLIF